MCTSATHPLHISVNMNSGPILLLVKHYLYYHIFKESFQTFIFLLILIKALYVPSFQFRSFFNLIYLSVICISLSFLVPGTSFPSKVLPTGTPILRRRNGKSDDAQNMPVGHPGSPPLSA